MHSITTLRTRARVVLFVSAVIFISAILCSAANTAFAAGNLIQNSDFATSDTVTDTAANWTQGGYGISSSTATIDAGRTGNGGVINITNYASGDAKWVFDPITITDQGAYYTFSDWYTSDVPSRLVAALSGGDAQHPDIYLPLVSLNATGGVGNTNWTQVTTSFTPYLGYTTVTIYHLIEANGTLATDDYSLEVTAPSSQNLFTNGMVSLTFDDGWKTQYDTALPILTAANLKATFYVIGKAVSQAVANPGDGYFTPADMLDLQSKDHEIGYHTESHCNLVFLNNGNSSSDPNTCAFPEPGLTWQAEIGSTTSSTVVSLGGTVSNLAFPNGATNSLISAFAQGKGYTSARTVDEGYNTKQSNLMALQVKVVDANTSTSTVKGWIDTALANKFWLILVFHQIDTPPVLIANGELGGTTPQTFTEIVEHLQTKPAGTVKTVKEALASMGVVVVPLDTTAPVIAAHSDVFETGTSAGATVTYTLPSVTDNDPAVTIACTPASGTVFAVGTTTVTCVAHDSAPNYATSTFAVGVTAAPVVVPVDIEITTASLPDGSTTGAYSQDIVASTSLSAPFTWSIRAGELPSGLSLGNSTSTTNTISGTPASATSSSFTVQVGNGLSTTTRAFTLLITTPAPPAPAAPPASNGGGGGGGGIVGSGPLSLGFVNNNPTGTTGSVLGAQTSCYVFTRTLQTGATGVEVTQLQNRLAQEGLFAVAASGYFGPVTRASVIAFQKKFGLEQVGIVGPKTRAQLNICSSQVVVPSIQPANTSTVIFTQTLTLGSTGAEVLALQNRLTTEAVYSGPITGYFGALTRAAVLAFQTKYGLPAVGIVGPLTRAALNGKVSNPNSQ